MTSIHSILNKDLLYNYFFQNYLNSDLGIILGKMD